MVNYEYQDYLKLWALLIGERTEGEYGVNFPRGYVQRYRVQQYAQGEFRGRLTALERCIYTGEADSHLYDAEYIERFGEIKLRLDLFMTYWERMQEAELSLTLQKGGIS